MNIASLQVDTATIMFALVTLFTISFLDSNYPKCADNDLTFKKRIS